MDLGSERNWNILSFEIPNTPIQEQRVAFELCSPKAAALGTTTIFPLRPLGALFYGSTIESTLTHRELTSVSV